MKAYCLNCKGEKTILYKKRKAYKTYTKYSGQCIKCRGDLCRVIAINV